MTALSRGDVLVRPRWARLRHCPVRGRWLFLVPESVLFPCPTTLEVLETLEKPTTFGAVVDRLAAGYDAPAETIEADLAPLVGQLVEQGYVRRLDA